MRPERPFANVRRLALRKILRIGAPIGLQMLAEIGVFSVLAVLAGRLGHVAAAAHQVTYTLWSFPYMAALGIGGAVAARVGHAIGDRRAAGDVGFVGIALGGAIMLVPALLLVVLRYPLVALFTNDPETIELGVSLLLVAAAFQVFDGVREVAAGALRGAADVRYAFLTNLGAHLLIGLPLALWLAFGLGWGARGLWLGTFASFALIAILLPLRFRALSKGLIARA